MLYLYVDNSRINPPAEVTGVLRQKLASGISCGVVMLGEAPEEARCAALVWRFDGCPPVEIVFDRMELESPDGAERVARRFLDAWPFRFVAERNGSESPVGKPAPEEPTPTTEKAAAK